MRSDHLPARDFAWVAELRCDVASRILRGFHEGRTAPWHGCVLKVRVGHGRGGRSGLQYEVALDSLPDHLQARWHDLQRSLGSPLKALPKVAEGSGEAAWWSRLLQPVLATGKGSAERAAAYATILGRPLTDWLGRPVEPCKRTLQRRADQLERNGIAAMAKAARSDRGKSRVHVSRRWDRAVPFSNETKAEIARMVRDEIRGHHKKGAEIRVIRLLVAERLVEWTRVYGYRPNDPNHLKTICRITKSAVRAEEAYRKVWCYKKDRKAHADAAPHIRRSKAGLLPMEIVVADVHHSNVLVERPDGSTATPKLLSYLDVATRRLWIETIFFENRGGVRNIDQIKAFTEMASHPAWGVPSNLYIDNGSEYLFADQLKDAMQFAFQTNAGVKQTILHRTDRDLRVLRANPYNARAKEIEAVFGHVEQGLFKLIPGYIGDDRMNPKREKIGKETRPFTGGVDALNKTVFSLLAAYENMPQQGGLKGLTPAQAFEQHVKNGWTATIIDPTELHTVFTRPETRKVGGDTVKAGGRTWYHEKLAAYADENVIVRISQYHPYNALRIEDGKGNFICNAEPDRVFDYLDPRGAIHSADRKKAYDKAVRDLDRSVPDVDTAGQLIAFGKAQIPVIPNAPAGVVSVLKDGDPVPLERARQVRAERRSRDPWADMPIQRTGTKEEMKAESDRLEQKLAMRRKGGPL